MSKTILKVEGMHCSSCVEHISQVLTSQGAARVEVKLDEGSVEIEHDPAVSPRRLIVALEEAGYDAIPRRDRPGHV